jgi:hypothetical protein
MAAPTRIFRWTDEEIQLIHDECVGGGRGDDVIAVMLTQMPENIERGCVRNKQQVRRRRIEQGWQRTFFEGDMGAVDEKRTLRADAAFQSLMAEAIRTGSEHAKCGIFKDDTPFVGRMIHPEPVSSGCSSAAGMCADAGEFLTTRERSFV